MAKRSKVGRLASKATKAEFGDELSSYTAVTAEEARKLFPKKSDREELVELLRIVTLSTTENNKRAELTRKIGKVSGAVIRVAKKFATGL